LERSVKIETGGWNWATSIQDSNPHGRKTQGKKSIGRRALLRAGIVAAGIAGIAADPAHSASDIIGKIRPSG